MDSLEVTFETYLTLNEEEFKVEVHASGDLIHDAFNHEFGTKHFTTIDNVFVNRIINMETDEVIVFSTLSKVQKKELMNLADEWLNEKEQEDMSEEYYG